MAATTHTHVRIAPRPRSDRGGATDELSPRHTVRPEEREWPTDTQVWTWAESAALSGYGPPALGFL